MIDLLNKLADLLRNLLGLVKELPMPPQQNIPIDPDALLPWDTLEGAHHNVRALCDLEGLTYRDKQILTACVKVESNFDPKAIHYNRDTNYKLLSTDFGIVQINDYWHIGAGKDFPTAEYVILHPEECVRFMCKYFKRNGHLNAWVAYTTGAYQRWLNKV